MSKSKINTRLNDFFSGINSGREEDIHPLEEGITQGFTWETDAHGLYTVCDKGIELVLGFSPADVIGAPLLSFRLPVEDQAKLRESLNNVSYPIEIELNSLTKQEELIKIRFTIYQKFDEGRQASGLRGYCEKLNINEDGQSLQSQADSESQNSTAPIATQEDMQPESNKPKRRTKKLRVPDTSTAPLVGDGNASIENTKNLKFPRKKKTGLTKDLTAEVKTGELKSVMQSPLISDQSQSEVVEIEKVSASLKELSGISLVKHQFEISTSVWTAQAQASFDDNQLVAIPSVNGSPAIMAAPLNLRNEKSGIIEIVDDQSDRIWTEEERLLLQEVSKQLGLALENTQLYSTIQHELSERVKAERLTIRRNKDLANLNQIGQQLRQLVSQKQIFEITTTMTQQIMGVDNLLLSLLDEKTGQLTFPICLVNGINMTLAPRPMAVGYQETVLETKKAILINQNLDHTLIEKNIDHSTYLPCSLLAVPLVAGDRAMGVLSVFDYQNENAFDQIQVELLSSATAQVAAALENTKLFTEISETLQLLESRQRVQSNVTDAVAELSLKGSGELPFLLKSLAQATLCERVYYAEAQESAEGDYFWHTLASYSNTDMGLLFNDSILQAMHFKDYSNWLVQLSSNGWYACTTDTTIAAEKEYLNSQNIKSLLLLAVKPENQPVGFIALENYTLFKDWNTEEVDILRVVADAFTNTLIRENLLEQLRTSLSETENLYTASHQLALADDMQEMITAIISSFSPSVINRGEIILFDYNLEGRISRMLVNASYSNNKDIPQPEVGVEYLVSLYEPVFTSTSPVFYDNIHESDLSQTLKDIFIGQNTNSMAVLPMWSGNVQIGVLLLQTNHKHRFTSVEIRSYPPLVDQMATAIQNLRLFESTQAALAETELIYKISSGITKSTTMEELTTLIGQNVLPRNCDSLFLFITANNKSIDPPDYEIAGSFSTQPISLPANLTVSSESAPFLRFQSSEPIILKNISQQNFSQSTHSFFKKLRMTTAVIIPLQTATNPVGFLVAGSHDLSDIDIKEAQTLQVIGNSIAVAVERQRLLQEAQRRALELQTAAEIARDTTSTLSQDILLSRIVNLLKDRFGYYHCSIFLLDESNTYAVVEESTGDAGKLMKENKHKLAVGSKSVIGTCIASGQAVIVNDTNLSPVFYPNPLLLETRSEMGIPLRIGGRIIGALDLQSTSTNAFSDNESTVLKILSDQISVAIENARAYSLSQKAVQEMRELDRVKSQFLANMSHELRTPLNSVIGFSRVILKGIDGPINKVQEQDITSIYNSGMNLLNMINEILDLSKIEAGKMELQIEEVNISEVISKAVSTATGLIKDKPIKIIQKIPPDLPLVKADETKIGQVILNFLSNAIKFTDNGEVLIEAMLTKDSNLNSEIKVTVTDSGVGILPGDQQKLFQRFSQVDDSPTRKTGGTGLGLSISRSLIELHGGKIGLQSSEPGKGSVFFFTLPVTIIQKGLDVNHLTHGENVILSIDDDPQVIALYERYLKNYGFEVVGLTNPAKALEKACELKPFAITLDIMMPQIDGWQVLHDLKQDERTRDIPILVCSILEEEEKGFNLGASEYLVKPFLQGDLINAIHRINRDNASLEVLVIDDDPDDLKFVKKMVEAEPTFHPTLAQGGKSALEILKNLTPDLIILDLFMPDMNGFELLDRFKSEPRWSRIPVIILTGADLTPEQKNQLAESSRVLSTHGLLKESDILKNMEEALQKIKPHPKD